MSHNLNIFRSEFLNANTWAQRKDGAPLYLLDKLSGNELNIAETELIEAISLKDDWPILGLGHIKSAPALPHLYALLPKTKNAYKITVAYSIFQICGDPDMITIVKEELPRVTDTFRLIDVMYKLPIFRDEKINSVLHSYCDHGDYLVAYNATRALGLPTDVIVKKFQQ